MQENNNVRSPSSSTPRLSPRPTHSSPTSTSVPEEETTSNCGSRCLYDDSDSEEERQPMSNPQTPKKSGDKVLINRRFLDISALSTSPHTPPKQPHKEAYFEDEWDSELEMGSLRDAEVPPRDRAALGHLARRLNFDSEPTEDTDSQRCSPLANRLESCLGDAIELQKTSPASTSLILDHSNGDEHSEGGA
ncbi:hypothetical protein AAF712_014188 [Marasmius tenuissimus]|uniref:Uncharacterized protein n=1 Tax=Marasmius tenuissimus TaxID=585030 RepID=A0ABR2ZDW9_9AGAR